MKQFTIATDGKTNTQAKSASADMMYGQYDDKSFQLHFSESEPTTKAQLTSLEKLFNKAVGDKLPEAVKQRSKNVIGFALKNANQTEADQGQQLALDAIKAEALKINKALKAAQAQGGQQTPPQGGGQTPPQGGGQNPPQGGGQPTPPKGGGQTPPQGGGQTPPQGGGQTPPKGGSQNPPQGGGQTPPKSGGQQSFDKTKDAFGRPLKQAYPGLFWDGMTPQEEEAACDRYWAMVRHVDKDIFHR